LIQGWKSHISIFFLGKKNFSKSLLVVEDRSYEFFQKSRFNRAQVEQFFEQCNVLKIPGGTLYLSDIFDDLFWLKGNWWSVKNYRMPKLQEEGDDRKVLPSPYVASNLLKEHQPNRSLNQSLLLFAQCSLISHILRFIGYHHQFFPFWSWFA
jgi:hypothetical protein